MRQDKVENFFYYDNEQNQRIEYHYRDCCDGKKPFDTKYEIVIKDYKYAIWGSSKDPDTWKQQNVSIVSG